jgi:hypothetical protein
VKTPGALVAAANFLQIFPPGLQAHKSILLGNTDYESTTGLATAIPLRPGNIYPESIRGRRFVLNPIAAFFLNPYGLKKSASVKKHAPLQVEALTYSETFESIIDRNFRNCPVHRADDNAEYNVDAMIKAFADKLIRSRQEYVTSPSGLTTRLRWASLCFALEENLFVTAFSSRNNFNSDEVKVTVTTDSPQRAADTIASLRKKFIAKQELEGPSFFIMTAGGRGVERAPLEAEHLLGAEQIGLHYGEDFAAWSAEFMAGLDEPGISILCGETGVGKTSYIRHVMSALSATHRFYFVPVDNFGLLSSGSLTEFWKAEQRTHPAAAKVLVLEDAETLLINREENARNPVSNILNLTDGLMTQFVKVHLLATLNCRRDSLDKALLRPGRLRFFRDFDRLTRERAQRIADHYKLRLADRDDYSLAEIFASEKFENHTAGVKKEKEAIGFGGGARRS